MTNARKVAVVTDSTSDLLKETAAERGITVVPLNVHFGDEVFGDQVDISTDEFMAKMATAEKLPTTSQPSVGAFETAFRAAGAQEIICPILSSRLSGTFQSAQIAAQNLAGEIKVELVDTLNVSYGLGFQVLRANNREDADATAEKLQQRFPEANILVDWVGSTIGTYAGPGAIGIMTLSASEA